MALSTLVSPQGSDFIKDFPFDNAQNCDNIDAYAGSCLAGHPLTLYSPSLRGATTDPVIGTGGGAVNRGWYYRIFDQVYAWGELKFGTTGASFGTGEIFIGLPFTTNSVINGNTIPGRAPILGNAKVVDASTPANTQPLIVQLVGKTEMQFQIHTNSGSATPVLSGLIPFTLAVGDSILWTARYKKESL